MCSNRRQALRYSVAVGLQILLLNIVVQPVLGMRESSKSDREVVTGMNHFGLALQRALSKQNPGDNTFFSPVSVSSALAMSLLGARGETASQIKQALKWDRVSNSDTQQSLRNIQQLLIQRQKSQYVLELANRLFVQESYGVLPSFLLDCQQYFEAQAENVDFVGHPEGTRVFINEWVEGSTHGKIEDLLKPGAVDEMTRIVLVNAAYFKGDWAFKFNEEHTKEALFHVSAAEIASVQMMFQKRKYNVGWDEDIGAQVLELPYRGDDLLMTIILPDQETSVQDVESKLTAEKLLSLRSALHNQTVELHMPRFSQSNDFDLEATLSQLGITDMFDESTADLSGINGKKDLFVSRVVHKAYIDVNEEGSEAAAATASVIQMRTMERNVQFVMDRPFLFFIHDSKTSLMLFMGRVMTPSVINGREEL